MQGSEFRYCTTRRWSTVHDSKHARLVHGSYRGGRSAGFADRSRCRARSPSRQSPPQGKRLRGPGEGRGPGGRLDLHGVRLEGGAYHPGPRRRHQRGGELHHGPGRADPQEPVGRLRRHEEARGGRGLLDRGGAGVRRDEPRIPGAKPSDPPPGPPARPGVDALRSRLHRRYALEHPGPRCAAPATGARGGLRAGLPALRLSRTRTLHRRLVGDPATHPGHERPRHPGRPGGLRLFPARRLRSGPLPRGRGATVRVLRRRGAHRDPRAAGAVPRGSGPGPDLRGPGPARRPPAPDRNGAHGGA